MKKLKFIVTLMLIFVTSAAYAQFSNTASIKSKSNGGGDYNKVSFRIQAGMNVSSLTVFDELLENMATEDGELKSKIGFNLGFRVDKQFNRYFAFQTGLDYTLKGVRTYYEYEDEYEGSYGSYGSYDGNSNNSYRGGDGMSNARRGRDGDGDGQYSERRGRDAMGRYTSRDSGYSRDASRQKMVDKLYTLLDDTMSDGERHAINECIEKIR
jgi:hypothetical protein